MILSDISVTRPVLAAVMSLLLIAFGLVSFERLPLREYPDIDPPVVSVETLYPGAAANVVETELRIRAKQLHGVDHGGVDEAPVLASQRARVLELGAQAWMTGTDGETFRALGEAAQFFYLREQRLWPGSAERL
jgi:hypothetical protein